MIRECIAAGGAIYILITLVQIIRRPALASEGLAVVAALALAAAFYWTRREHELHAAETVAFWACVLFFAGYGILKVWGVA
ncbi:MAG: hypothetical protein A4E35_00347 [Methanoregula sp. PtaU1.Bin051]|nr:MAG: hypothetical protein A4E35_00347 [Methanoregula sp. PtaU1.Bin051]